MPAPKVYIGSKEVAALMSISLRQAQYILRMFEQQGKTVNVGSQAAASHKRVSLKVLADYLSTQDGSDPRETFEAIKTALKSTDDGH